MEALQIIFANRKDCFEKPGGDTVQMMKTKEYLEKKYPVQIVICTNAGDFEKYPNAKIVHIFNLQTVNESKEFIEKAKKLKKITFLSTIYWNLLDSYYVKYLRFLNINPVQVKDFYKQILINCFNIGILFIPFLKNKFKKYVDKGLFGTRKYFDLRRDVLLDADFLLPNSDEEMLLCSKDFNIPLDEIKNKSIVVPNAVEYQELTEKKDFNLPEKYVVTAGRISVEKNQLNTLKALYDYPDIGIVFVGNVEDKAYYNTIKKIADKRGNVFFISHINQQELFSIFKNSICHVLPSFRESPGLVSLETLSQGKNIVVSNEKYCPIKYYEFDKYAELCNPYSPKSIRNAIFNVINNNNPLEISDEYLYKISYDNVAKTTFEAYTKYLNYNNTGCQC